MSKLHLHARLRGLFISLIAALIGPTVLAEDFSVELLPLTSEHPPVNASFTAEVIPLESPALSAKRVLIYHTHTYEALQQSTTDLKTMQTLLWKKTIEGLLTFLCLGWLLIFPDRESSHFRSE